jgi:hypothetical protein
MKLRRQAIAQKYGREIAAVYGGALGLDADVPLARRMATSAQGPGPAA